MKPCLQALSITQITLKEPVPVSKVNAAARSPNRFGKTEGWIKSTEEQIWGRKKKIPAGNGTARLMHDCDC